MSVFDYASLLTEVSSTSKDQDSYERKLLKSKLESLNNHLEALIQKKIRLDLEIRRTRKKLSKLKTQSSTKVKLGISAEGFNVPSNREEVSLLQEQIDPQIFKSLADLDLEIDRSEEILETYKDLPLYGENPR